MGPSNLYDKKSFTGMIEFLYWIYILEVIKYAYGHKSKIWIQ